MRGLNLLGDGSLQRQWIWEYPFPHTTALSLYDGCRSARLPANLLQAQRDYFDAHTCERVDKPRGEFFHTNWTVEGMDDVFSGTYNA